MSFLPMACHSSRRLTVVVALVAAGILMVWPAAAQETTGTITGVVSDASGGVLPGVTVTVTHVRTGFALDRVTKAS